MKITIKKFVNYVGLGSFLTIFLLFSLIFLYAYFSPEKSILYSIDNYGEAHLEFVLFIFMAIFATLFVYQNNLLGGKK